MHFLNRSAWRRQRVQLSSSESFYFRFSMEKLPKPYGKEFMKMAMLKHEETFKQQVYELHRLYRIQKILMKSIEYSRPKKERWDSRSGISLNQINDHHHTHHKTRPGIDLEQPAECIEESDGEGAPEIEDESEIQLTLGPTSYYRRKKAETPRTSDSGPSFSSSSTGSSHMKRTTSGTHQGRREDLTGQRWGLTMVPDSNSSGLQSGRKNSFDVEDRLKQPHWLFQTLSLKMT